MLNWQHLRPRPLRLTTPLFSLWWWSLLQTPPAGRESLWWGVLLSGMVVSGEEDNVTSRCWHWVGADICSGAGFFNFLFFLLITFCNIMMIIEYLNIFFLFISLFFLTLNIINFIELSTDFCFDVFRLLAISTDSYFDWFIFRCKTISIYHNNPQKCLLSKLKVSKNHAFKAIFKARYIFNYLKAWNFQEPFNIENKTKRKKNKNDINQNPRRVQYQ